jgi:hypothetical protein
MIDIAQHVHRSALLEKWAFLRLPWPMPYVTPYQGTGEIKVRLRIFIVTIKILHKGGALARAWAGTHPTNSPRAAAARACAAGLAAMIISSGNLLPARSF